MEKDGSSTFMTGLGIGVGAGVLIGLLIAPKSGSDTRHVIRKSASEGEEFLERRTAEFRDTLKDLIRTVTRHRDSLSAALEAGKEAYRKAVGRTAAEPPASPDRDIAGSANRPMGTAEQTGMA